MIAMRIATYRLEQPTCTAIERERQSDLSTKISYYSVFRMERQAF